MKKKILIALLVIAVIALGFLREYVFVSINEKTSHGLSGISNPGQHTLFIWKWPLTAAFAVSYFAITCLFLHLLFARKKYIRIAVFLYAVLVAVSITAAATGFLISSVESVYPFIRTVMGIAQSPVVIMLLVPACFLNEAITRKGS